MKRKVTIIFALVLCISVLAACGGDPENEKVVGTWTIDTMENAEKTVTVKEYEERAGTEFDMSFEFKSNGNVTVSSMGTVMEKSKYKVDGDDVVITYPDGTVLTLELSGDTLIMDQGDKFIFVRK